MNSDIEEKLNKFTRKVVYWERQGQNRLCGIHCINSLMQGPFFDISMLSEISSNLDEMERKLLEDDSDKYKVDKKFSTNVELDGNYNIQVLSEALKIYNVEIIPVKKSDVEVLLKEKLDELEAFIFNSSTHWFALRKICGVWFNLNSTNDEPGPQIISDFYLSAFIKGTEELGYTNFLVKNLPELCDYKTYNNLSSYQRFVEYEKILKSKPRKINYGDSDEVELERAMEASKKEFGNTY